MPCISFYKSIIKFHSKKINLKISILSPQKISKIKKIINQIYLLHTLGGYGIIKKKEKENHIMSVIISKLNVEGMSCSHCERAVKNGLNELNGVLNTEVDLQGKMVTVEYETDSIDEARIIEEIEDIGYDVVQ